MQSRAETRAECGGGRQTENEGKDMCISDGLIADYIEDFREKKARPGLRKLVGIAPFPIVWFGNREAYAASEARVVTVGLNPSRLEFEKGADRFRGLGDSGLPDPGRLAGALDGYFREGGNPCKWFDKLEAVLGGIHASYRENRGARAVALHVDACSAIATSTSWGRLDESQKRLLEDDGGRNLFRRLMDELEPDFILFSCNGNLVEKFSPDSSPSGKSPMSRKLENRPGGPASKCVRISSRSW